MKNILLLVLLCTSVFASATITIIKSNGGPSGYSDIYENHNNNGDHGLSCKNPGYDACVFTNPPSIIGSISGNLYDVVPLAMLVEDQIALGNYSGTIIHNDEIIITWRGSATNYTITVDNL